VKSLQIVGRRAEILPSGCTGCMSNDEAAWESVVWMSWPCPSKLVTGILGRQVVCRRKLKLMPRKENIISPDWRSQKQQEREHTRAIEIRSSSSCSLICTISVSGLGWGFIDRRERVIAVARGAALLSIIGPKRAGQYSHVVLVDGQTTPARQLGRCQQQFVELCEESGEISRKGDELCTKP